MVSSQEASTYGFYANVAIACILSIVFLEGERGGPPGGSHAPHPEDLSPS